MAAADFAKSRAGQAAAAVNVSLGTLEKHAGDAVKTFTGKDEYTFGDIMATLVSRGAGTIAKAMSARRGVAQHAESGSGVGGGDVGGAAVKEGTSGKVAAAAGAAGAAAAAITKKFSGLTSSFSKRSTATSTDENNAPASAGESTSDAAAVAAATAASDCWPIQTAAVATAAKPGMYHRIFAKNKPHAAIPEDGKADVAVVEQEEEEVEEESPYFFIPGKVYHLRRGPLGAGASAAHVAADSPTLCKIELSSSLIADHSLGEYGEALDTLAIRPAAPQLPAAPRVEVSGTLEWEEAGGLKYNVGMGKWTSYEGCYILAHELCLKRPNRDGELLPIKLDLWGYGFSAERHEYKGKGPFGIKITDPGNKTTIRLHVPGGEEELGMWLAAIERCCQGLRGSPAPPPFAATPVAVF